MDVFTTNHVGNKHLKHLKYSNQKLATPLSRYIQNGAETALGEIARMYDSAGVEKLPQEFDSLVNQIANENNTFDLFSENFFKIFARQLQLACREYLFVDPDALPPILKRSVQKKLGLDQCAYAKCSDYKKAQLADAIATSYMSWLSVAIKKKLALETNIELNRTIDNALSEDRHRRTVLNKMLYHQSPTLPYVLSRDELINKATNPLLQDVKNGHNLVKEQKNKNSHQLGVFDKDFRRKQNEKESTPFYSKILIDFKRGNSTFIQMECCFQYEEQAFQKKLEKVFGVELAKAIAKAYGQELYGLLTLLTTARTDNRFACHLYKDRDKVFFDIVNVAAKRKDDSDPSVFLPGGVQYRWRFDQESKQFQLEWCAVENSLQASCFYRDLEKDQVTQEECEASEYLSVAFLQRFHLLNTVLNQSLQLLKENRFRLIKNEQSALPFADEQKFLLIVKNIAGYAKTLYDDNIPDAFSKAVKVLDLAENLKKTIDTSKTIKNMGSLAITFNNAIKEKEKELAIPREIWKPILLNIVILPIALIYAAFVGITAEENSLAKVKSVPFRVKFCQYLIGGKSRTQQLLEDSKAALSVSLITVSSKKMN